MFRAPGQFRWQSVWRQAQRCATTPSLPLFQRAAQFGANTAIVSENKSRTYNDLLSSADSIRSRLLETEGSNDLAEGRVAFFYPGSFAYTAVEWGVWAAGGVAVPLHTGHPAPELEYIIRDSQAKVVVVPEQKAAMIREICDKISSSSSDNNNNNKIKVIETKAEDFLPTQQLAPHETCHRGGCYEIKPERRALMIYTSGTTGKPKGVVTTHNNIEAQVSALVEAWEWRSTDHILHVLPVHHVHGVINVLTCALWSGAKCTFPSFPNNAAFDAEATWELFKSTDPDMQLTLFMAVPTIYSMLIKAYEAASPEAQRAYNDACAKFRLMVSGSAALPVSTLEKWRAITGHTLLERYGMTEIGMALSNAYRGTRYPGMVGFPLPRVQVKLANEENGVGELLIKGPAVFQEYWNKPEATAQTFDKDGWFLTGDQANYSKDGGYRILGRSSTDILKTAGYKISALDVEEVIRKHGDVADCAVVGLPSEEFGQIVAAVVVPKSSKGIEANKLRAYCRKEMASYKVPRKILIMDAIPKNAMGKVNKKELLKLFK